MRRMIFGGDAQRALGADEDAEQVVAGGVERFAAEVTIVAVGEHDVQPQHVGGGEAVLEAVGAAGVLGDVAADGADRLRATGRARRSSPRRRRRR